MRQSISLACHLVETNITLGLFPNLNAFENKTVGRERRQRQLTAQKHSMANPKRKLLSEC